MTLLQRLKSGWTTLKFIRVGLGGLILYSSIESGQVAGIIFGGLLLIVSLVTDGICCSGGSCNIPATKKNTPSANENFVYEELDSE